MRYITDVSLSIASVMKPAGFEKAKGLITANYGKDTTDPRWKDDPGVKEFTAFAKKYLSGNDLIDSNAIYGFGAAATMVQVLKQCGADLSRDNVMKQAANLKDFELPMLLPGIKINTSPDNFSPIRQDATSRGSTARAGSCSGICFRAEAHNFGPPRESGEGRGIPLFLRRGAQQQGEVTGSKKGGNS